MELISYWQLKYFTIFYIQKICTTMYKIHWTDKIKQLHKMEVKYDIKIYNFDTQWIFIAVNFTYDNNNNL